MKVKSLIFLAGCFLIFVNSLFCEEETLTDQMSKGFKRAMEEIDITKMEEKAKREKEIEMNLSSFIDEWLVSQSSKRKAQINSPIEKTWENVYEDIYETPFIYYLRDYLYTVQKMDIVETDSVTYPYQANVLTKEFLYVERAPLIAEPRSDYHYTVDTDIAINLQYNKEAARFKTVNISKNQGILKKGWPEKIKKKVKTYFIPAR